jgi:hypothetical protein
MISLRQVVAKAPAAEGSFPPVAAETNRVAAAGRASWVKVVNKAPAAARRDISPIWDRFRIRTRRK